MRKSDRAWLALVGGVAAYDLIATDDELLSGLHLVGGLPRWCDPFALVFAACRRLRLLRL